MRLPCIWTRLERSVDEVMEAETDVEEAGPVDSDSVSIALEGGEADGLLRDCS